MLLEPDETRATQGPIWRSAKIQALHDIRDDERQQRITVKGQIRLEPRRTRNQANEAAITKGRPGRKIIKGEKRAHVVSKLAETLDQSRITPFEFEGTTRHALRSELCLEGHGWHDADSEAAALVEEGLARLGAKRPSYDEGQREYSVSPDYCSWCHSPLEDVPSTRKVSYCDEVCAKAAVQAREINFHRHETRAFNAAWTTIARSQHAAHECEECGKKFRPSRMDMPNRFCSPKCAATNIGRSSRVLTARTCPSCETVFQPRRASQVHCSPRCGAEARRTVPRCQCEQCGTTFQPASNTGPNRFCSKACAYEHRSRVKFRCTCSWCGSVFEAGRVGSEYCSNACLLTARRFRLGKVPTRLLAHVFDHFVSLPTNSPPTTMRN